MDPSHQGSQDDSLRDPTGPSNLTFLSSTEVLRIGLIAPNMNVIFWVPFVIHVCLHGARLAPWVLVFVILRPMRTDSLRLRLLARGSSQCDTPAR